MILFFYGIAIPVFLCLVEVIDSSKFLWLVGSRGMGLCHSLTLLATGQLLSAGPECRPRTLDVIFSSFFFSHFSCLLGLLQHVTVAYSPGLHLCTNHPCHLE